MARSGTKTSTLMLTRKDEFEGGVAGESFGVTQKMQSCQTPVDAVQSEMFGEPVLEFIFPLSAYEPREWCQCGVGILTESKLWMY